MLLTPQDHKLRANQYLQILEVLNSSQINTSDWQVTLAFYSALQIIEFDLSHYEDITCTNHLQRSQLIMPSTQGLKYEVPGSVYGAYNRLENASKIARYMDGKPKKSMKTPDFQFFTGKKFKQILKDLDLVIDFYESKRTCKFHTPVIYVNSGVQEGDFKVIQVVQKNLSTAK